MVEGFTSCWAHQKTFPLTTPPLHPVCAACAGLRAETMAGIILLDAEVLPFHKRDEDLGSKALNSKP